MVLTAGFLPAVVCGVAFAVNFIAIYYSATRAIPFTTMLVIVALWAFVVLPLTLVGAVLGRNMAGAPDLPCRVNPVPRPIPEKKWFMEPVVIVLLGGILPFGSIFIEMYFIFTSFWAYKIYYVYGFMLLVFVILAIVTVCVCIVCTYFLLNSEVRGPFCLFVWVWAHRRWGTRRKFTESLFVGGGGGGGRTPGGRVPPTTRARRPPKKCTRTPTTTNL